MQKGMDLDSSPMLAQEGGYHLAHNMTARSPLGEVGGLSNELGNKLYTSLPDGYRLCGHIPLVDGEHILFCSKVDGNYTNSMVLLFSEDAEKKVQVLADDKTSKHEHKLMLSIDHPVRGVFRTRRGGLRTIYFTDGYNPVRTLDIDRMDKYKQEGVFNARFCSLQRPIRKLPKIEELKVNDSGGVLRAGTYNFAIRYMDGDLNPTNWLLFTDTVIVYYDLRQADFSSIRGSAYNPGNETLHSGEGIKSISIVLNPDSLDEEFAYYQIAVIADKNQSISELAVNYTEPIPIRDHIWIYTGENAPEIGTLEGLNRVEPSIAKCDHMLIKDNRLLLAGIQGEEEDWKIYEEAAMQIRSQCVLRTAELTTTKRFGVKCPEIHIDGQGYQSDEVYSFGIVYVFDDGKQSPVFHIPGSRGTDGSIRKDEDTDRYLSMGDGTSAHMSYEDKKKVRHHKFPRRTGPIAVPKSELLAQMPQVYRTSVYICYKYLANYFKDDSYSNAPISITINYLELNDKGISIGVEKTKQIQIYPNYYLDSKVDPVPREPFVFGLPKFSFKNFFSFCWTRKCREKEAQKDKDAKEKEHNDKQNQKQRSYSYVGIFNIPQENGVGDWHQEISPMLWGRRGDYMEGDNMDDEALSKAIDEGKAHRIEYRGPAGHSAGQIYYRSLYGTEGITGGWTTIDNAPAWYYKNIHHLSRKMEIYIDSYNKVRVTSIQVGDNYRNVQHIPYSQAASDIYRVAIKLEADEIMAINGWKREGDSEASRRVRGSIYNPYECSPYSYTPNGNKSVNIAGVKPPTPDSKNLDMVLHGKNEQGVTEYVTRYFFGFLSPQDRSASRRYEDYISINVICSAGSRLSLNDRDYSGDIYGIQFFNIKKPKNTKKEIVGYYIVRQERKPENRNVMDGAIFYGSKENGAYIGVGRQITDWQPNHMTLGMFTIGNKFERIAPGMVSQIKPVGILVNPNGEQRFENKLHINDVKEGTSYSKDHHEDNDDDGWELECHTLHSYYKLKSNSRGRPISGTGIKAMFQLSPLEYRELEGKTIFNTQSDNRISVLALRKPGGNIENAGPYYIKKYEMHYGLLMNDIKDNYPNYRSQPYFFEHSNMQEFDKDDAKASHITLFHGDTYINFVSSWATFFWKNVIATRRPKKQPWWKWIVGAFSFAAGLAAAFLIPGAGLAIGGALMGLGLNLIISGVKESLVIAAYSGDYDRGLRETVSDGFMKRFDGKRYDDTIQWMCEVANSFVLESYLNANLALVTSDPENMKFPAMVTEHGQVTTGYARRKLCKPNPQRRDKEEIRPIPIQEFYLLNKAYIRRCREGGMYTLPTAWEATPQKFANRVMYSEQSFREEQADNMRMFFINNYKDFGGETGPIMNMFSLRNSLFLHTTNSIWQQETALRLQLSGDHVSFVGSGEYLAAPALEVSRDVGITHITSGKVVGDIYAFISPRQKKIMMFNGREFQPLSDKGVSAWAEYVLATPNVEDTPYTDFGTGFDIYKDNNRILFSRRWKTLGDNTTVIRIPDFERKKREMLAKSVTSKNYSKTYTFSGYTPAGAAQFLVTEKKYTERMEVVNTEEPPMQAPQVEQPIYKDRVIETRGNPLKESTFLLIFIDFSKTTYRKAETNEVLPAVDLDTMLNVTPPINDTPKPPYHGWGHSYPEVDGKKYSYSYPDTPVKSNSKINYNDNFHDLDVYFSGDNTGYGMEYFAINLKNLRNKAETMTTKVFTIDIKANLYEGKYYTGDAIVNGEVDLILELLPKENVDNPDDEKGLMVRDNREIYVDSDLRNGDKKIIPTKVSNIAKSHNVYKDPQYNLAQIQLDLQNYVAKYSTHRGSDTPMWKDVGWNDNTVLATRTETYQSGTEWVDQPETEPETITEEIPQTDVDTKTWHEYIQPERFSTDGIKDKGFTLSYDLINKTWTSFHSYKPMIYLGGKDTFYSIEDGKNIWQHRAGTFCNYYGKQDRGIIELCFPTAGQGVLQAMSVVANIYSYRGEKFYPSREFYDSFMAYNNFQNSGYISTYVYDDGIYRINDFVQRNDGGDSMWLDMVSPDKKINSSIFVNDSFSEVQLRGSWICLRIEVQEGGKLATFISAVPQMSRQNLQEQRR